MKLLVNEKLVSQNCRFISILENCIFFLQFLQIGVYTAQTLTQLTLRTGFILFLEAFTDDKGWRLQTYFRWLVFLFSVSKQFVPSLLVISINSPHCFIYLARTQIHNLILDVVWAIWKYVLNTRNQFTLCWFVFMCVVSVCFRVGLVFLGGLVDWLGWFWIFLLAGCFFLEFWGAWYFWLFFRGGD